MKVPVRIGLTVLIILFLAAALSYGQDVLVKDLTKIMDYHEGVNYAAKGKFKKAKEKFEKALKVDPSFEDASRALEVIENVTDRKIAKKSAIHFFKGVVYEGESQWDKAIAECSKAIELNPRFAYAYANRGVIYERKGQYDKAIFDHTETIKVKPRFALAYNNRAKAYQKKGQYDKAIADLSKAVELNPRLYIAFYNRGNAYDDRGQYDKAIADFDKAIELNPEFPVAYNNRGIAYYNKGEYDKAREDVRKAQSLGYPVHPALLNALRKASPEKSTGSQEACEEDCKKMFEKGELRQGMTVEDCIKMLCK